MAGLFSVVCFDGLTPTKSSAFIFLAVMVVFNLCFVLALAFSKLEWLGSHLQIIMNLRSLVYVFDFLAGQALGSLLKK